MTEDRQASGAAESAAAAAAVDNKMVKGAFWMVLARAMERTIGFASTIVLARLLAPEDFGLVAMATALIVMLEIVSSFGFDVALIQNKNATRSHFDTAWTCNVLLGATIALSLLAISQPAAWFYDEPRLAVVVQCLAFAAFVQGCENVGIIAFRKDLHFNKDFKVILAKKSTTFLVTIPLAFLLRNYWALVIGIMVGRTMSMVLTYVMHPYRPKFSLAERHQLFGFGKWLVVTSMLSFLSTRCLDFLIGKMAGTHALGLFSVSYEMANLPTNDLVAPINRATFSGYAQKAGHVPTLARSFLDVLGLLALVAAPAGLGIAAVSGLMVPVVFGAKWLDATPVLATLAVFGTVLALKSNNHYIYLALGRPKMVTLVGGIYVFILLPLVGFGSWTAGIGGAAQGCLIAEILFTPISMEIVRHQLRLGHWEVYRPFFRPVVAAILMYVVVRLVAAEFISRAPHGAALPGQLLVSIAVGAVVYVTALAAMWFLASRPNSAERHVLEYVQTKVWPTLREMRFVAR